MCYHERMYCFGMQSKCLFGSDEEGMKLHYIRVPLNDIFKNKTGLHGVKTRERIISA